jgi:hypothetical protein
MFMRLDANNRPTGWTESATDGYIEVDAATHTLHCEHPEYTWDGSKLVAPAAPVPYVPSLEEKTNDALAKRVLGMVHAFAKMNATDTSQQAAGQAELKSEADACLNEIKNL